jgi:hypothetical protein
MCSSAAAISAEVLAASMWAASGGEALAMARVKHFSAASSDWVEKRNAKICFESQEFSKETTVVMQCHATSCNVMQCLSVS